LPGLIACTTNCCSTTERAKRSNGCVYCSTDIDECCLGTDDCSENAMCMNTEGSFECKCNPGYTGDGRQCDGKWIMYDVCVCVYVCMCVCVCVHVCMTGFPTEAKIIVLKIIDQVKDALYS
jgi:hypothetical protein